MPPSKYCYPRRSEISSVPLCQSAKVNRVTLGRNPRSKLMRPHHPASTAYTAQYGFTSESRTISSAGYLKFGKATTRVSDVPFRLPLRLKSAICLNGCDDKRPWLPDSARSAINGRKPWRCASKRDACKESAIGLCQSLRARAFSQRYWAITSHPAASGIPSTSVARAVGPRATFDSNPWDGRAPCSPRLRVTPSHAPQPTAG